MRESYGQDLSLSPSRVVAKSAPATACDGHHSFRLKCDGRHSFLPPFVLEVDSPEGEDMTPIPSNLQVILATVLVVAAFITINALSAIAKNENGWKALSAPGTIHRSGLVNLY